MQESNNSDSTQPRALEISSPQHTFAATDRPKTLRRGLRSTSPGNRPRATETPRPSHSLVRPPGNPSRSDANRAVPLILATTRCSQTVFYKAGRQRPDKEQLQKGQAFAGTVR